MTYPNIQSARILLLLMLVASLGACVSQPAGIGKQVSWSSLKGWGQDSLTQAWPAFEQSCRSLTKRNQQWEQICLEASLLQEADELTRHEFIQTRFVPYRMNPALDNKQGLITGYYEPQLEGSRKRSKRFRYAVYGRPDDLLIVDLSAVYPDLDGKRVRGRLKGNRVVPYYSRGQIHNGKNPLKGKELLWVDDVVALFFLHIQGSGVVRLRDGSMVGVGYSDQNGHPYKAIGAALIAQDEIPREQVSLQTIRDWLQENPDKAEDLMNSNPSYVFFELRKNVTKGPIGSLGVPLTSERSVAVDRRYISLGLPLWLETSLPDTGRSVADGAKTESTKNNEAKLEPYTRLVFAQDTGGAINGSVRADLFWGRGSRAELFAGHMKQPGHLFVLLPRPMQDSGAALATREANAR